MNDKKFVNLSSKYRILLDKIIKEFNHTDIENIAKNTISNKRIFEIYNQVNELLDKCECGPYDINHIINNYKKKNIKPEGFIISNDKIFLSLNNGRLVVIETLTGKPTDVVKIDSQKISRPYILNNEMFIVRDNAIIKLN